MQPGDTIKPESHNDNSKDEAGELKVPRDDGPVNTEDAQVQETQDSPQSYPSNEPSTLPENHDKSQAEPDNAYQPEPSPGFYTQAPSSPQSSASIEPITWTASEFVDHEKSPSWFIGLAGATVVIVVMAYLLTQELLTVFAILSAAALFGVTAKRKPNTVQCQVDQNGVSVGGKFYPYSTFRSFSVMPEGHFNSIVLTPLKRLGLPLTLYYLPEMAEKLVNTLGSYLPLETRNLDPVEKLMHKVRF